ncbi:MAG: hypothetical protein ACRD3V_33885 [Vicinamibacteria bacterium]
MASNAGKSGGIASKEDALRWIRRFEAAEEVDRAAARRDGPRPQWSIAMSLSLIEAARTAGFLSPSALALREAEDQAVRRTWDRLRAGLPK